MAKCFFDQISSHQRSLNGFGLFVMEQNSIQDILNILTQNVAHDLSLWLKAQADLGAEYAPIDDPSWGASPNAHPIPTSPASKSNASSSPRKTLDSSLAPQIAKDGTPIDRAPTKAVSSPSPQAPAQHSTAHQPSLLESFRGCMASRPKVAVPENDEERSRMLNMLNHQIRACNHCRLESEHAILPGKGTLHPIVMFIGAGAYRPEADSQTFLAGEGARIFQNALKSLENRIPNFSFQNIYTTNLMKCATSFPKDQLSSACTACLKHLKREIELVQPHVIVAFGALVYNALFPNNRNIISQLRGNISYYNSIPVMPTHNPYEIAKNPQLEQRVLEDLALAIQNRKR